MVTRCRQSPDELQTHCVGRAKGWFAQESGGCAARDPWRGIPMLLPGPKNSLQLCSLGRTHRNKAMSAVSMRLPLSEGQRPAVNVYCFASVHR